MGCGESKIKSINLAQDTSKSFSEALIFASTNPQYDKRLFIDLPVLYMKTTSSGHVCAFHVIFDTWQSVQIGAEFGIFVFF